MGVTGVLSIRPFEVSMRHTSLSGLGGAPVKYCR